MVSQTAAILVERLFRPLPLPVLLFTLVPDVQVASTCEFTDSPV